MPYKNKNCLRCGLKYSPNNPTQKFCFECGLINKKEWIKKNKKRKKEWSKKYQQRPEVKVKLKEYMKEYYQKNKDKPEFIEKQKKNRQRPEVKKKTKGYNQRSDVRKRKKEWSKKNYQIPKVKERLKKNYDKYCENNKEKENQRRKKLNLPLIGEGFKAEMELLVYVHHLFGNYNILTHHRKPLMDWKPKGLELDIYIPELKLAFEYNGKQHYVKGCFNKSDEEFEAQQYRDRCKKKICKLKGITLIKIKYDEKLSEQLILTKLKYIQGLQINQERLIC